MSSEPVTEPSPTSQPLEPERQTAMQRLAEIKRDLQGLLRRKGTRYEIAARDRAAYMLLRHEIACRDPKSTSEDIVRLHNSSRRAVNDFMETCRIKPRQAKPRSMADIEKEVRAHG